MIKKKNNYVEISVSASKVKIPKNQKIKSKQGYLLHLRVMQILSCINYSLAAKFWDIIVFKIPFFSCVYFAFAVIFVTNKESPLQMFE